MNTEATWEDHDDFALCFLEIAPWEQGGSKGWEVVTRIKSLIVNYQATTTQQQFKSQISTKSAAVQQQISNIKITHKS